MHYIPWDEWIVLALFLVGVGGGGFFYAYVLWMKAHKTLDRGLKNALIISPIITLLGLFILLVDLGRPERFLNALFHFNPHSIMNLGVFIQAFFVNIALGVVILIYLRKTETKLFEYAMHGGMVFGVLIALYHGLLPVSMPRDGWSGGLVFVMFFSSILSGRAFVEYITQSAHSTPLFNFSVLVSFWVSVAIWIYTLSIGTLGERAVLEFLFLQWDFSLLMLGVLFMSGLFTTLLMARELYVKRHPSRLLIFGGVSIEFFGAFMLKYGVILAGQLTFLAR